jgi:hypothetical protein
MHRQAWVKINAQVDARLQLLVSVLSRIPKLQTISSCEGQSGKRQGYIHFYFGDWKAVSRFLFKEIAPALYGLEASVSVEVFNGSEPLGKMSFRAEELERVTSALKSVLSRRRLRCVRDKGHKGPRS